MLFIASSQALKFEIQAHHSHDHKPWRCIRNWIVKDVLVVVTATANGYKGDGMAVNMHVSIHVELLMISHVLTELPLLDCRYRR
jgi:hypothetical protein